MDLLAAPPRLSPSGVVLVGTGWGGSSAEAGLRRQGVRGRAAARRLRWPPGMAVTWQMAAYARRRRHTVAGRQAVCCCWPNITEELISAPPPAICALFVLLPVFWRPGTVE